ncbi:MAG TPA: phage portal protein, partial [Planctomycetaceae bacterium]|nr:phage portal protein [Planctomycetaceae bacterium]
YYGPQFYDPREQYYDDPSFWPIASTAGLAFYQTQADDRNNGKFRPIFETETDLHIIRAQAGRVLWFDGIGLGALESLKNGTFQKGLEYPVSSLDEAFVPEAMVDEVRELIEHILFVNGYYGGDSGFCLESEYHDRARIDGEWQSEITWRDGDAVWHEHEPEHLCEPDRRAKEDLEEWLGLEFPQCWKFGVHTPEKQTESPLGYHFVFDANGNDWDYVPAERMIHYRRNVFRKVKRGISDFYPVVEDLKENSELRQALGKGAKLQASIAWITEHPPGTRSSAITGAVVAGADFKSQVQKESGTQYAYHQKYRPGSIINLKAGKTYKPGPLGSERNPNFILVAQHLMRAVGVRFSLPEFMISDDASNGTYSSTTQASDWYVKAREKNQFEFGWPIVGMLYKSLRMYANRGLLDLRGLAWEEFRKYIRITPKGQDPSMKSPLEKREALALEMDYGLTSEETAATECGRNFEEEKAKGAERQASPNMQAEQQMVGGDGSSQSKEKKIAESLLEGARRWST